MPELCPVEPHDKSEIPDLLHLAKIYESGLGKLWNSKTEATRILAITYPRIRREHLTWSTQLLDLPEEVLDLFKAVGIGVWANRSIIDAQRAHGLPVLLEKAAAVKAANKNFSRAQLVSMLTSEGSPPVRKFSRAEPIQSEENVSEVLSRGEPRAMVVVSWGRGGARPRQACYRRGMRVFRSSTHDKKTASSENAAHMTYADRFLRLRKH
jgi:hypothetical protein